MVAFAAGAALYQISTGAPWWSSKEALSGTVNAGMKGAATTAQAVVAVGALVTEGDPAPAEQVGSDVESDLAPDAENIGPTVDKIGADIKQGIDELSTTTSESEETAKGGVYTLTNPMGKVVRVGMTKDFDMRQKSYNNDNSFFDLKFDRVYSTDDYATRRGLEQKLFDEFQPPLNINRPIRIGNPNIANYINAANEFLARINQITQGN